MSDLYTQKIVTFCPSYTNSFSRVHLCLIYLNNLNRSSIINFELILILQMLQHVESIMVFAYRYSQILIAW